MKPLVFSTGNDSKFTTAVEVCKRYDIELIQNSLEIDEIQGENPEKIVIDKVSKAFKLIKKPVVVSDDTWVIPGLNGFPGSYMKSMNHWFEPEDFIRLTSSLDDRRIFLVGYLAYKDGNQLKLLHQKREGTLLKEARGVHEPASHQVISMVDTQELTLGDGVTAAQFIDSAELQDSTDIFEKLVYEVAHEAL